MGLGGEWNWCLWWNEAWIVGKESWYKCESVLKFIEFLFYQYFPHLASMKTQTSNCEDKRKSRTVSTFLKKTYELLNVLTNLCRTTKTTIRSDGHHQGLGSLLWTRNHFPSWFFPNTLSTATIHLLSDRYWCFDSAEHVQLPQNPWEQSGELLPSWTF